uniref:Folate receptor-like domain-containing protein n=1 Tax=Sphenodon punctatus TaxID=8508 RepID=A0A8D0GR97_SPHPU
YIRATLATCKKDKCLEGGSHKNQPDPEPDFKECTLYTKSSCCSPDFTEELAHSPIIKVNTTYWDRCGTLSESCENYMKKIECFYQCSPHAARWSNPNYTAAIEFVPLCQNFCDDWYEACKDDSTCIHNWLIDWEYDEYGENHCKNRCFPYSQMYANGTDMCQNMWGNSFTVSDSSCRCLQMNEKDAVAVKYLQLDSSEESSSSSSSSSSEEQACQRKLRKMARRKEQEGVEIVE